MKRFTETNKWDDPWYRKLSPQAKHLLNYLRDKCDCAGVVEIDFDAISFHVGEPIKEQHLAELESRLQHLPGAKVLMPKFVVFQYGVLSDSCPAHRPIIKLVSKHGLDRVGLEYHYPTAYPNARVAVPIETSTKIPISYPTGRVQEKEKEKDKEKEEGVQGETDRLALVAELHLTWQARTGFEAAQMTYERMWVDFLDVGHRKPDLELVIEHSKVLNKDRDAKYHAPLELGRLISDLTKFSDRLMAAKAWVKAGRPLESRKESNEETPRVIPKSEWVRNAL